jgi:methionine-rich copper-binding protein CopC
MFQLKPGNYIKLSHLFDRRACVFSMTMLWITAIVFLVVHAMAHDHVVFTEEPVSTTFRPQEMERFHRTFRKHSHNANGKGVIC